APRDPCGRPLISRHPHPTAPAEVRPASVVIRRPSPLLVRVPAPAVVGVDPVAVVIRTPAGTYARLKAIAVILDIQPVAVGFEFTVEKFEGDGRCRLGARRRKSDQRTGQREKEDAKWFH